MTALIGALLGLAVVGGVILLVVGLQRTPTLIRPDRVQTSVLQRIQGARAGVRNAAVGGGIGVLIAIATGMPALVPICAALGYTAPPLFGKPSTARGLARAEAIEMWVRGLTGMMTGGIGIEDAIRTSLPSTPTAIRPEVARLVGRLHAQVPIEPALRLWADEMDDRVADLVAAALIMGAGTRRGGVSQALEDLASSVAEQTRTMQRIEADRAGTRTAARFITGLSVAMFAVIVIGPMGEAYRDPLGQLILLVLGALYALVLRWMTTLSAGKPRPRFLSTPERTKAGLA